MEHEKRKPLLHEEHEKNEPVDEASDLPEVEEAFEFLDLNDEDKELLKADLEYMKESDSQGSYYRKACGQFRSIANQIKSTGKRVIPLEAIRDLVDTMKDFNERIPHLGKQPRVVLIGETGVGKSTLGNVLLEGHGKDTPFWKQEPTESRTVFLEGYGEVEQHFKTSSSVSSCTQNLKERDGYRLGNRERKKITVIDTPGLNDCEVSDEGRVSGMIEELRKTAYISTFVLVMNGSAVRFTEPHKQMIDIFRSVFGIDLFTNIVIVFTNWGMDEASKKRREATGESEEFKRKEINKSFRDFFEITCDLTCFFVDSIDYLEKIGDDWKCTENVLEQFISSVEEMVPYPTINIKALKRKNEKFDCELENLVESTEMCQRKSQVRDEKLDRTLSELKQLLQRRKMGEASSSSIKIMPETTNQTIQSADESLYEQIKFKESKTFLEKCWDQCKGYPVVVHLRCAVWLIEMMWKERNAKSS